MGQRPAGSERGTVDVSNKRRGGAGAVGGLGNSEAIGQNSGALKRDVPVQLNSFMELKRKAKGHEEVCQWTVSVNLWWNLRNLNK